MVDELLKTFRGTWGTTADFDQVNLVKCRATIYYTQETITVTLVVVDLENVHVQLVVEGVV